MLRQPAARAPATTSSARHRPPDDPAPVGRHLADVGVLAEAAGEIAAHRGQGVGGRCRAGNGRAASSRWDPPRWRSGSRRPGCRGRRRGSRAPRTCPVRPGSMRQWWAQRKQWTCGPPRHTSQSAARTASTGRSMRVTSSAVSARACGGFASAPTMAAMPNSARIHASAGPCAPLPPATSVDQVVPGGQPLDQSRRPGPPPCARARRCPRLCGLRMAAGQPSRSSCTDQ